MNLNNKLFVYGTLREGEGNHYLIVDNVKSIQKATIRGWMYHLGGYPAVIEGEGYITGELIEFYNPIEAFQRIDVLEGYHQPNSPSNHYERITVTAMTEDGGEETCQVYIYPLYRRKQLMEHYSLISSGDWVEQKKWIPYFAYGSCMNQASFADDVPIYRVIGRAVLPNYRVAFTRWSSIRKGGVADILPSQGSDTEGILYLIPESLLEALDAREGVGFGAYRRIEVNTIVGDQKIKAISYEVVSKAEQEFAPSATYRDTILQGTDLLSPEYVDKLKAHMRELEGQKV